MKILTYGINFYPELTGIGKYTGEMCFELAKRHEVTMITAYPYYPHWKVKSGYSNKWWKRVVIDNVKVIRCPFYVPAQPTAKTRILHEFSFLLSSSLTFFRYLFKPVDIVVCVVTPFHLGLVAALFAKLKGIPMVYHIQDLQVDAARDLKMINNERLLSFLEKLECWILDRATAVSTISEGMIGKILKKGVNKGKMIFFPNWVDANVIYPMKKEESLKRELGFSDTDKIVLYSGNLGEKQGLEQIIEVASELKSNKSLHFVIVGEGGIKSRLMEEAKSKALSRVHFLPLQPYERLSALLAMADLHLILQKKSAADLVMPSKLTSILSVGGCALVTASEGTTLYDVVRNHNLGILIEPENSTLLKDAIEIAIGRDLSIYQKNARQYAEHFLNKETILSKFEKDIQALTGRS